MTFSQPHSQPLDDNPHERRLGGYLPHVLPTHGRSDRNRSKPDWWRETLDGGPARSWLLVSWIGHSLCSLSAPTAHLCGPSLLNNMSRTLYQRDAIAGEDTTTCGEGTSSEDLPLRIASIFVILVGASFATLFPVLSRRTKYLRSRIPKGVFDTAKYFGSGVIVSHPQLLINFLSHTDRRSPLRLSIS